MQGGSDIIALFSNKFASFYFFEQGELLGFFLVFRRGILWVTLVLQSCVWTEEISHMEPLRKPV